MRALRLKLENKHFWFWAVIGQLIFQVDVKKLSFQPPKFKKQNKKLDLLVGQKDQHADIIPDFGTFSLFEK